MSALTKGMCCEISGLISQPHLNGQRCILDKLVDGRWAVKKEDGGFISLRLGNLSEAPTPLARGMRCVISGLVSMPHHNGRKCTLEKLENGRWTALLEDGNTVSLKPSNLSAVPRPPLADIFKPGFTGNGGGAAPPPKKAAAASKGGAAKRKRDVESETVEISSDEGGQEGAEEEEGGESAGGKKVALAKAWEEGKHDPTNWLMSEKLDGMRYPKPRTTILSDTLYQSSDLFKVNSP